MRDTFMEGKAGTQAAEDVARIETRGLGEILYLGRTVISERSPLSPCLNTQRGREKTAG